MTIHDIIDKLDTYGIHVALVDANATHQPPLTDITAYVTSTCNINNIALNNINTMLFDAKEGKGYIDLTIITHYDNCFEKLHDVLGCYLQYLHVNELLKYDELKQVYDCLFTYCINKALHLYNFDDNPYMY